MGNSLPLPCVCHEAATAGAAKKRRRKKAPASRNVLKAASPRHVVPVVVDMPPEDSDDEEAWPRCRVEPAGYGDDGGVLVKIVLKRKDAADLVARLDQRGAAERKARMEEISTDLGGAVTVAMSPCRDAWRPRLASIPENS
ncbi:hypothetical protein ACP70R_035802 [Stipagrostis hirtigluma subsp. patula]